MPCRTTVLPLEEIGRAKKYKITLLCIFVVHLNSTKIGSRVAMLALCIPVVKFMHCLVAEDTTRGIMALPHWPIGGVDHHR